MYIYIYIYAIIKAMCPPGYHHKDFVATHVLGYIYIYTNFECLLSAYWGHERVPLPTPPSKNSLIPPPFPPNFYSLPIKSQFNPIKN